MAAAVTGGRHQPGEPAPSTRSHRMPRLPKAWRHRGRKGKFWAKEEYAPAPPDVTREKLATHESRSKGVSWGKSVSEAPGTKETPEREETSPVSAGQGQGEPSTQDSVPGPSEMLEREEPSLVSTSQSQGEPSTQGSVESVVVECGHPPGDPSHSIVRDIPETGRSPGQRRKKPSMVEGEQAALLPEAMRGAGEQQESRRKAPGLNATLEREEPSLVSAGQGQGEPPTQDSGESTVVECGHPPGDPGPSSDHQDPPESCKTQDPSQRKKPSVAEGEQAALPPEAPRGAEEQGDSRAKVPGPNDKPQREEPSLVSAGQGQGEPPTQGSGESIVVECGHPPGDPGPSSDHQDPPESCKTRDPSQRNKPSVAEGEQAALPPEAPRGAEEQGESRAKAPGPNDKPEREEPSLVSAGPGQGEPPTQGSGESIVVECGHPPGDPGPSSDHQDPPKTCKSRGRRRRKKPSVAEREQAALPSEAPGGAEDEGQSRAKAPGPREMPEREEPSLVSAGQGQGEPPTQGSGESIVVECGHPSGDPGPSSDHQDTPETCKSRGQSRKKKPSVAKGEQAALPPEATRGAGEQEESRAKAPGPREEPEREEPSLVSAGQGQGEPPTQGSGESTVVECGHPPGDPGPSIDHQDVPECWESRGRSRKRKPSEARRGARIQRGPRAKAPGPREKPKREEPSLVSAGQGQGEPPTQGSGESTVVECGHPPGDPGPSIDHQDPPKTCKSRGRRRRKKPSVAEGEQAALPAEAPRGAEEQGESRAKAPGPREKPDREEPGLVSAGQGQGEPPTQGSGESIVVECGDPPGHPGPSSDHQDPPESCKSRGRRKRKNLSVAAGEQACLLPQALRGAGEQGESRAKAPGPREKPKREEPSLVSAGQGQGEPPTQGSGESTVVECGHPPGDPGPSIDHQDVPECWESRGRSRKRKPSMAEGEQAALPSEARRGARIQRAPRAKAPGPREKPKREEPSLVSAGQGQGEPPTQGSGESTVVECGHPPGDPGPSIDHQNPPETCKSRGRRRRKKPSVAEGLMEVFGAWVSSTAATSFGGMEVYVASLIADQRKRPQALDNAAVSMDSGVASD
ncbi:filaggrin-2-like [Phyllostomus hastatus]|uniref:filaggrin-2-like n=1 Tax=Phyllostomus hastatus TaxID=9423 RepID=UPI001E68088E|nr:filaggrin-2-like [Phyllostomus hastatus]